MPSIKWQGKPLGHKPKVVVTRKLPDPVETRMMELFDTRLNLAETPLSVARNWSKRSQMPTFWFRL